MGSYKVVMSEFIELRRREQNGDTEASYLWRQKEEGLGAIIDRTEVDMLIELEDGLR